MSQRIDLEAMKQEARKIVAEIAETSEEEIKDSDNFVEDLGVDSMMALEIVAADMLAELRRQCGDHIHIGSADFSYGHIDVDEFCSRYKDQLE